MSISFKYIKHVQLIENYLYPIFNVCFSFPSPKYATDRKPTRIDDWWEPIMVGRGEGGSKYKYEITTRIGCSYL